MGQPVPPFVVGAAVDVTPPDGQTYQTTVTRIKPWPDEGDGAWWEIQYTTDWPYDTYENTYVEMDLGTTRPQWPDIAAAAGDHPAQQPEIPPSHRAAGGA